jgi:3-hydroxyisobutyrate dehydrogenase-like beta-hydroxyacid dehydrogenase
MGSAMAKRLVDAGHRVTVYNRTASKTAPLVAAGARAAATPAEAARGNEIVITMVTGSKDTEEVILGPAGVLQGAAPGTVVVDMTTTSPDCARRVGRELRARGIGFLDSPVTGMEIRAREGTLSLFVGGEEADLGRARDVLSVLGNKITRFGPNGTGQLIKACNQVMCCVNLVGVVEALHLARLSDIDLGLAVEALLPGAGSSWQLQRFGPQIAAGDFAPGGKISLMLKDLDIIRDEASRLGLPLEGAEVARKRFQENLAAGEQDLGTQAMFKAVERAIRR